MLIFFVGIIHLSIAYRLTGFKSPKAETAETQPGVSIWIVAHVHRTLLFTAQPMSEYQARENLWRNLIGLRITA